MLIKLRDQDNFFVIFWISGLALYPKLITIHLQQISIMANKITRFILILYLTVKLTMNLDSNSIWEICIDESDDDVEFIGKTFKSANINKTFNSCRYVRQIGSTTETIKLPTPFYNEELSKLFNVEMKVNTEEKGKPLFKFNYTFF